MLYSQSHCGSRTDRVAIHNKSQGSLCSFEGVGNYINEAFSDAKVSSETKSILLKLAGRSLCEQQLVTISSGGTAFWRNQLLSPFFSKWDTLFFFAAPTLELFFYTNHDTN